MEAEFPGLQGCAKKIQDLTVIRATKDEKQRKGHLRQLWLDFFHKTGFHFLVLTIGSKWGDLIFLPTASFIKIVVLLVFLRNF